MSLPSHQIIVNGRRHVAFGDAISYGQIVTTVSDGRLDHETDATLTITYYRGKPGSERGILTMHQRVPLCDGMVFNAVDTSGA